MTERIVNGEGQTLQRSVEPDGPGRAWGCGLRAVWIVLSVFFLSQASTLLPARATTAGMCDAAAVRAARASGVPVSVLRAITRTETGRSREGVLQPWPWTVNMEGVGKWFDTETAARAYVQTRFDLGARSFDVGCFQINYRWHGKAFASIDEMFDPDANALYAARFLSQLHDETGDWMKAAGAYHSRTKELADRYAVRFERIRARLTDQPRIAAAAETIGTAVREKTRDAIRQNSYPLLQGTGEAAGFGSLVPLSGAVRPALVTLLHDRNES